MNRLSLNAKKTKIMIFHSKQNKLSVNEIPIIKINGMPIERVTLALVRKKSFHTTMSAISKLNTPIQSSAVFVLDYKIPELIKENYLPKIVLEKMDTHSYAGFTKYAKIILLANTKLCKKITNTNVGAIS